MMAFAPSCNECKLLLESDFSVILSRRSAFLSIRWLRVQVPPISMSGVLPRGKPVRKYTEANFRVFCGRC